MAGLVPDCRFWASDMASYPVLPGIGIPEVLCTYHDCHYLFTWSPWAFLFLFFAYLEDTFFSAE